MRERVLEQPAIPEPVSQPFLELLELVPQVDDARADVFAMALDDAPGIVGGFVGHGNPDVAQRVDGHRPDRLRIPGDAEARDAVAVEQRHDDAGFDVGRGREHDDGRHAGRAAAVPLLRPRVGQSTARSCRRAERRSRKGMHLAQHPLAQLVERQRAVLLDQGDQATVAEPLTRFAGRIRQTIRIQHEEVACRDGNGHLLQETIERLPIVDPQPEHQPIRGQHLPARRCGATAGR